MVCNFFQVRFSTSESVTVIALALGPLAEKLYNNSTNCTREEKTVFGKAEKKELEKAGKYGAKINNDTDTGKLETHHHILESLSHSALEVGSL